MRAYPAPCSRPDATRRPQAIGWGLAMAWVLALLGTSPVLAQVGINFDGASPDPKAVLDVNADALPANNKKGLLLPSVALNTAIWSYTGPGASPSPPNPFLGHGVGNMVTSLWLYNTTAYTAPAGFVYPSSTTTGLYWWETGGQRWLRQQARVLPTQHHVSTDTIAGGSDGAWVTIPGLQTVTLQLQAGDRVLFSASGTLTLPPPVPPDQGSGYVHAGVRVRVGGAATTTAAQTTTSVVDDVQFISNGGCALWIFCNSSTGVFSTLLKLQSWRLVGAYDVLAPGAYTFSVQIARLLGNTRVIGGGNAVTHPELRSMLTVEVIRP